MRKRNRQGIGSVARLAVVTVLEHANLRKPWRRVAKARAAGFRAGGAAFS
jgi:hypothetical protein